ncbi:large ribosomal subunit protein uL14m-like [Haliotis cracherodii]|nr:39S ribosomal protein L14, mitochondrial-like isoform X3 [Haliotis rufescens]XP_046336854.1 39S ribosomal protein L14, mitochondrial-like isoform X3 [Haliotis rufescens]XP_046336862.1 39S ribosomal protein L14, mitochondrial-like isoform X3 [Haliotis rufescens]XP_046336867.1 39S ribosomal protein L14, mitochondrial-like isoform X3 [Haliotis rufescens]XP_048258882.1 39S ribosomal protein L14, mitochondrial-like isoform X3 [Haliotis rufescens]
MSSALQRVLQQAAVQAAVPSGSLAFSTTACLHEIRKMARMRVVDNSSLGKAALASGKPPRVIHVYNKKEVATIGDKVLLAIKGQKKRAYVVGVKQKQRANVPRFDSNNVVLIEDNGAPTGTRIAVPVPSVLRGKSGDFTKILSIATRFV